MTLHVFRLSALLLMFLDLFFYFCLRFLMFLLLHFLFFFFHFYFKFYFLWGRWQACVSVLRFLRRFSCHDSSNLLSANGWLHSSSSLLYEDCSSLSPNAWVKILVSLFDIFLSVFEYESTNCLCEPRLLQYVLLMYSTAVAWGSVFSSFFARKNSSAWQLVNFVSAFL